MPRNILVGIAAGMMPEPPPQERMVAHLRGDSLKQERPAGFYTDGPLLP